MKTTRKLLLALVLVMSILMTLAVAVIPASAASSSDGKTYVYADVSYWDPNSARFAAYFFGPNGNTWVSMTKHSGNIYKVEVPAGTWSNVIFCRMNKSASANNWNNKWNQTGDLSLDKAKNNCYFKVNAWDGAGDAQWKGHNPGVAATCTTAQTCTVCTEVITAALNHNTDGVVAHKDATCTGTGVVGGNYCTRCDNGKTAAEATIPALNHNTDGVVAHKDATCTETGVVGGNYCTRCDNGKTAAETTIPVLEHNYGEDGKAATCGTCGHANPDACQHDWVNADCVLPKTCSKCGDTEGEPNGHGTIHHVTAVPATCTEVGNPEYWYCEDCNMATTVEGLEYNTPVSRMVIGATGHDMADAACTAPSTCKNGCGLTEGEPNGHSHTSSVTAPTCEAAGYTTYTCSVCGDSYTDNNVDALGHDMVTDEAKAPTCTETGLTEGSHCSRCSGATTAQETVPATGHTFVKTADDNSCCNEGCDEKAYTIIYFQNNWKWTDVRVYYWDANEKSNASWPGQTITKIGTENGHDLYMVKVPAGTVGVIFNGKDGSTRKQTNDITNLENCYCHYMDWNEKDGDHSGSWKLHNHTLETVDPTCTEPGYTRYTCNGDTFTTVIPATGHVNTTTTTVGATCTNPGSTTVTCACGHVVSTTEIPVDADAHYAGCGHYAADGDSLQAALGNGSVELTKPVSVSGALTIVSGATLDLKGQTLTADAIVTFNGTIIDTVGTGKIIVNVDSETNKPMLQITKGNYDYAPIHVETKDGKSTFAITPVKVQGVTADLSNTAVVRPSLKGQYTNKELFADNVIAHGISFHLVVTRTKGGVSEQATLDFTEEQIKTLYTNNNHAIKITLVGGLEGYTYTVELVVESAGVQVHSTEVAILTVPVTSTTEEEGETTNN